MKKYQIIFFLFVSIFYIGCVDNTTPIEYGVWINKIIPNPVNLNDTVTIFMIEEGAYNSRIDSLSQVSVMLTNGMLTQQQIVTGYRLGARPFVLGNFKNYNFIDTLQSYVFVQFALSDNPLTNSRINVRLKDYLIKSDIVFTIIK